MLCVFREGGIKIVLNMSFQACEVRSSCGIVRRLIIAGGIVDGCMLACGLWRKKCERLLRDRVSARAFSDQPGKWTADNAILNLAVIKCKQRIRAIA